MLCLRFYKHQSAKEDKARLYESNYTQQNALPTNRAVFGKTQFIVDTQIRYVIFPRPRRGSWCNLLSIRDCDNFLEKLKRASFSCTQQSAFIFIHHLSSHKESMKTKLDSLDIQLLKKKEEKKQDNHFLSSPFFLELSC